MTINISPNNNKNKINNLNKYNYLMPNIFTCFQGITADAGTKFNQK